jgi:hypothetical protein
MPVTLPHSVKKLLHDKAYGHVVTFNAQGKPQLTMVWMDVDGDEVIIVSVQDRNDPQAYAVFHGKARVTETGADDHIDKLAKRFLNADKYPFRRPGETRLIVRISVDRIGGFGPKMQPWT